MTRKATILLLFASAGAVALYAAGGVEWIAHVIEERGSAANGRLSEVAPPAVTVARVAPAEFVETVLVTGSLVPREDVLVAPEVDGLRIIDLKVDVGDTVKVGDVLATLETETLEAQLAQNHANLARSEAGIAQAKSQIAEAEARLAEARAALERAKPLTKSGYLSDSVYDQRNAAEKTAAAQVTAAMDGLKAAEAERRQVEAQRRELEWRRSRTEVKAPVDGLISRRGAHIGAITVSATFGTQSDPLFRIIKNGEVELDAEVPERELGKISVGQMVKVAVAGGVEIEGKVRLISPEVDTASRLGRVRVFLGADARLKIGAFARGEIETRRSRGLAIPVSAVSSTPDENSVQRLVGDKVETTRVVTGLSSKGLIEVRTGLADGDVVVARAGTFLRDGDVVRPVEPEESKADAGKVSEVR